MTKEYADFLAHHGIKGQKWGVRNFQNEDGTLKHPKGEKRNGNKKPESKTWKAREARNLSDEELDRRNRRLQRENQYRQNIDTGHPAKKEIKAAAKKILLASAIGVATSIVTKKYMAGAKFLSDSAWMKINLSNLR